jgi:hypothetical protein
MIWIGGGILYLVLIVTLGLMCIRKGHWVMFIVGLVLPFFWLIGALMPPVRA